MDVFQCPECELRFRYSNELDDHLATDHPGFEREPRSVEGALVAASHRHRKAAPRYPSGYRLEARAMGEAAAASAGGQSGPWPPSLRVRREDGDRFAIVVRGHEAFVDQPRDDGGEDSAPTPTELFVASLASCVAFYAGRFMNRHGVPGDLVVTATWRTAARPARVAAIDVEVSAPGVSDEKRDRFLSVIEHCTVHNTLQAPPEVAIRLAQEDAEIAS